jgi:hypothetical protein
VNTINLKEKLDNLAVNENLYSLNGNLLPDRVILYNSYDKWLVFYFDERGNRDEEQNFNSENEACQYIYNYFRKSENF